MKKAPRIKKALGGNVYGNAINDGDKDKKAAADLAAKKEALRQFAIKNKVVTTNTTYDSPQVQQGFNKSTIKKGLNTSTNTGGGTTAPIDIKDAGSRYKKGGEVKKMTKAPFRFKKK